METRLKRIKALILHRFLFGESSDVVVLFSRELGKLKAMAKGRRRPGSKLGVALETLSFSELVIYFERSRELQLIKEASLIEPFKKLRESYELLRWASMISELLERGTETLTPNEGLFKLAIKTLHALTEHERYARKLITAFLMRSLDLLGHAPQLQNCAKCGKTENLSHFSISTGGILCTDCAKNAPDSLPICPGFLSELRTLRRMQLEKVTRLRIDEPRALILLVNFARYHLGIPDLFHKKVDI